MVAIVNRKEMKAIVPQPKISFRHRWKLIQIEGQHEDLVIEWLSLRHQSLMHHLALIEPGNV